MALRKRGKSGYWHAYFRTIVSQGDGSLKYATTTVNLFTDDLITARRPGFYHNDNQSSFFKRAVQRGLKISSVQVQAGKIRCMDLAELYRIGKDLILKEGNIL